jgi:calcineurin-like phosphoesterase family protein
MPRINREVWITGCQHYGHRIERLLSRRGCTSVDEHDHIIMSNHNEVVGPKDIVIHAGDFALCHPDRAAEILKSLNGHHIMIEGDHDRNYRQMQRKKNGLLFDLRPPVFSVSIDKQHVVICHWCMRTWPRSHYNSWHVHAHHHGHELPKGHFGKTYEISVDNNNLYPVSFPELQKIMSNRPDNENFIDPEDRQ